MMDKDTVIALMAASIYGGLIAIHPTQAILRRQAIEEAETLWLEVIRQARAPKD